MTYLGGVNHLSRGHHVEPVASASLLSLSTVASLICYQLAGSLDAQVIWEFTMREFVIIDGTAERLLGGLGNGMSREYISVSRA